MRTFTAIEVEDSDFQDQPRAHAAWWAMTDAELVTYQGEIIKNRNGPTCQTFFSLAARAITVAGLDQPGVETRNAEPETAVL